MLPLIAIPDAADARIVFDALNAYYQQLPQGESRERALLLLIATHADMTRTADTETGN